MIDDNCIQTIIDKNFQQTNILVNHQIESYNDYIDNGSEIKSKEAGKMRLEGKDYVVEDGDIMHFRFNI